MADNRVVHAKTTEKTLRLDDKLLKQISDKAYSLRLSSDQGLMRQILEEYFKREEVFPISCVNIFESRHSQESDADTEKER